jgi:hypothetical protein
VLTNVYRSEKSLSVNGDNSARLTWTSCLVAVLLLVWIAEESPAQQGGWRGDPGIKETVGDIMGRDGRGSGPDQSEKRKERGQNNNQRTQNPDSPRVAQWPPASHPATADTSPTDPKSTDAGVFSANVVDIPLVSDQQTTGTNFLGPVLADSGWYPPNAIGAVGPTQILVVVNGRIRSYNKSGVADGVLNTDTNNFFNSVRNGANTSDTRAVFDVLSQRWFISMLNMQAAPNRLLIAVSGSATISSATSFSFFYFVQDGSSGPPVLLGSGSPGSATVDNGLFADYPSLGVDNNAVYMGVNIFSPDLTSYQGATAFVINKANLLSGTLTVTAFRRIGSNGSNIFSPLGVTNPDPNATEGYFIGADVNFFGLLRIRRITNPDTTPTLSSTISITVPTTANPFPVPAQGSTKNLSALDDRLGNAQIINGNLWTTHSIQVDATGVGGGTTGTARNAMRFYEINNLTGTPALVQSGTLFDSSATNPLFYWVGSIAASGQGHAIVGASSAGSAANAGAVFAGRMAGDTAGAISSPAVIATGGGSYNPSDSSNPYRWGDLSNSVVDPTDNMTMWTFQEYTNATNSWGVRVTQLKAPPPATPSVASPASVPAGATTSVTITGLSPGDEGFYDPPASFPNHIAATVNGGGVTVNSVTYTDPTHITLGVTVDSGAAQTARTVTVTNPDGQSVTSSTSIFQITAPETITLSPATGNLPTGTVSVLYSQTITASGGTAPYTFTVSTGVLPAGLLLTTAGVISGTPTTSGSETFTIQAVDVFGSAGSTQYTLKISSLITGNFSLAINGTTYSATPSPGYVGRYTINTTLKNNGSAVNTAIYLKITTLQKQGTDLIPSQPDKLLSADNGAGVVGDTQQVIAALGAGQSTPLSLLVGIGSRQRFTIFFELYTILSGSAMTAVDENTFKGAAAFMPLINTGDAPVLDTAPPGTPVLLGQFEVRAFEGIPPAAPKDSDVSADPLSNVGIITDAGPQSTPSIAVDPLIARRMAIAANDYVTRTVRVSTTRDGGLTWHVTTLGRTVLNQDFGIAEDASVAFDSFGRLSVVYVLSNPYDSANAIVISESTDGMNFTLPVAITFHPSSEQVVDSRPVIAVKAGGGRYVAWDRLSLTTLRYSIQIVRSEEGGIFGPVTTVVGNVLASSPALALSKNTIYIGWNEWGFNSVPPYNTGGRLMIASSPAGPPRMDFGNPREIARTSIGFRRRIPAMPEKGAGPNLSLAVDGDKENVLYAVFVDQGNGLDIRFARSRNRGNTWEFTTVNNDGSSADQFSPAMAVGEDSNVTISFYDTRLSSTFETAHVFIARSTDRAAFDNQRITTTTSNDSKTNPQRDFTSNLGDSTGIAIASGKSVVVWTDTRLGSEDVFFSSIGVK